MNSGIPQIDSLSLMITAAQASISGAALTQVFAGGVDPTMTPAAIPAIVIQLMTNDLRYQENLMTLQLDYIASYDEDQTQEQNYVIHYKNVNNLVKALKYLPKTVGYLIEPKFYMDGDSITMLGPVFDDAKQNYINGRIRVDCGLSQS